MTRVRSSLLQPEHPSVKTAALHPERVIRSAELNHVESACDESPNTSPLTPPTVQLTPRPRPSLISLRQLPPSDIFEEEKACQLLIGHRGRFYQKQILCWVLMCGSGSALENEKQLACGSSPISHYTYRWGSGQQDERRGSFMDVSAADTLVLFLTRQPFTSLLYLWIALFLSDATGKGIYRPHSVLLSSLNA